MDALNINKGVVVTILFLIMAIFVYNLFFKDDLTLTAGLTDTEQTNGQDLLDLYHRLETVTFDKGIFNLPSYRSLIDFSRPIPEQPLGRPNPYDIVGKDNGTVGAAGSVR